MSIEQVVKLYVGQACEKSALMEQLKMLSYVENRLVGQEGEYSSRGNMVDVFPVSYRKPVRIMFDLEKVESIRDFSVTSGASLMSYQELRLIPLSKVSKKRMERRGRLSEQREPLDDIRHLKQGDIVVHLNYGIGIFAGSKVLRVDGKSVRHLAIEYADSEILYVEEKEFPLLDRYLGFEGKPPKLHKLNTKEWVRQRDKTRRALKSYAHELLQLQARRRVLHGFQAKADTDWQAQFEREFPYKETPDQIQSTLEVKQDMESSMPMDRLLCGDVGYGKTEVAFRAAFKAIMSGKQVAFLVPTTILAEQHFLTFSKRVKNFPVRVEVLSRFKTRSEQVETVSHLKDGSCDMVIGTHRLLSSDVKFRELGLVIIDEEQRFGVRHKEKLKHMRQLVDVLTLTATPIPRTLYMAFVGVRDMSVINTPPKDRMPVETHVLDYNEARIAEAIRNEIGRDGQVFFVHNRVQSIDRVYRNLRKLLPEIRIAVAHGQLAAHTLEDTMFRFIGREVDCLISTNIIESGLDIPNANTLIINRADQFGLADLYQLRGRVGRLDKKAYAYFIVPKHKRLTEDAEKRLRAIERFSELGSGIQISLEDLEIRGAGNLLGSEQSGFIFQVGFDLYCRMLRMAIDEIK